MVYASGRERFSKPAPPHNPLYAWGVCGCVECSRKVLEARCQYKFKVNLPESRCGDYRGHRGAHTALVATTFLIAEERVRLDG